MRCALFLLALFCGAIAAPAQEDAVNEFVTGNRKFTAAVYKELLKLEKGNFVVSPLSAEVVLALTHEGAKGETAAELSTGLSLPSSNEKTQLAMKHLLPKFTRSEDKLKLLSANKIFVGKDVKLEPSFRAVATEIYKSDVGNVDFKANIQAANTINQWVEAQTNSKIQNLITPNSLDEYTKMVLVNALYFSGEWKNTFNEYATSKQKFFKTKEDALEIDTMRQLNSFNYHENEALNAKFVELPYKGGDISMTIILPNDIDGLSKLEQNLENLFEPQPYRTERVDLQLPKFKIESSIKFVPILKNLGVDKLFKDFVADLSGLSSTNKDLVVSDVIQKAFIEVDESGTEAAAATAVIVAVPTSAIIYRPPVKVYQFHADHPFIYLIKVNGVVAFAGRHVQPKV